MTRRVTPAALASVLAFASAKDTHNADACCWCDQKTPTDKRTFVDSESQIHRLVFSDEFDEPNRDFANGKDAKWTALHVGDTSNKGAAFYLSEQATVELDGGSSTNETVSALLIKTINESYTGDSPTGQKGIEMPFRSAMLQSWNKFCFTGGVVEFRARSPRGGGYWPALWAFGNLGRAVYQNSNTGLWPWSYDQCDDRLELPPTDPPQRISACMDHSLEATGLHPFQGRGATELDVLEAAVTNTGKDSYSVGSLQLSPGIPAYYRPPLFSMPLKDGPGSWYHGLKFGPRGLPNNGWYGPPWGEDCPTGCPDALSGGLTKINDFDTRYWTYRMEWKLGRAGGLKWYYDDEFVWSMDAASFGPYSVCSSKPGEEDDCKTTPARDIPREPMSLVMNTAIGTWNGGKTALDGKHWPAEFWIDYVRVWQKEVNIGCDPPDYPTRKYIELNADLYGEPVAPLGHETCPEIYPQSAYDHASEITARAEARRATAGIVAAKRAAKAQTAAAGTVAAAAATAPVSASPTTAAFSNAGVVNLEARSVARGPMNKASTEEERGTSSWTFGSGALVMVGIVAAVAVLARQTGLGSSKYDPFPTADESATAYELAR